MSCFGSQMKSTDMLKRIGNITLMCAFALAALSCSRPDEVPDTPERKTPIDFAPTSRDVATKAGPLSAYHSDFGVWGIARPSDASLQDYVLWESAAMSKVEKSQTDDAVYTPVEDAFWLGGYTYDFIALAPWEAAGALQSGSIIPGTASGTDKLTFTCSLADKYTAGTYDFDLMAAVAQTPARASATDYDAQPLTFWHLFSQINIEVTFGDDAGGSVSQMRLKNVDQDITYTIASDDGDINVSSVNESRVCTVNPLVFGPSDESKWTLNIVPQNISDFEMYIDFVIGTGDSAVTYTDFKLNLNPSGSTNPADYVWNHQYNWKIAIGQKAHISFTVEVEKWIEASVPDGDKESEEDGNNDIEII